MGTGEEVKKNKPPRIESKRFLEGVWVDFRVSTAFEQGHSHQSGHIVAAY